MKELLKKIWRQSSAIEKISLIVSLIIFTYNTLVLLIILRMK